MEKINIDTLLVETDLRFKHFLFARSLTPYIDEKVWDTNSEAGFVVIPTAHLYNEFGFNAMIQLYQANVDYQDWRDAGDWINKGFIISLYALLDHWGVVYYIRTSLDSTEGIDKDYWSLLCNLRHTLVHSFESFPIQKSNTSTNLKETIRLQKKLYPLLLKDELKPNLDIHNFIIPFYLKLREILINQLSKYNEYNCDNHGILTGVQVEESGKEHVV